MTELQTLPPFRTFPYMGLALTVINRLLAMVVMMAVSATLVQAEVPVAPAAPIASPTAPIRIVALGDSLTAGYMLPPKDAFPAQLAAALKARGHSVDMINAGVSGDTTANGLERFDWSVAEGTEAVVLELGANDGLRGIDPAVAAKNLDAILMKLKARNIEVLIAGILAPQNWGQDYSATFSATFRDLSTKYGTLLYPFFLDGIAQKPEFNLSDGLHPTRKGVAVIVERIMPSVEALLERVKARRALAVKN